MRFARRCMVVCIFAVCVIAPPAHATYFGDNGQISFDVYTGAGPSFAIWTMDPDGTDRHLLIDSGLNSAWSPDGRRVAYACNPGPVYGSQNTCTAGANGTDIDVLPNHGLVPQNAPFWSPDSKRLIIDNVYSEGHSGTGGAMYRIDVADGDDQIRMANAAASGSWSPNGRIAYERFSGDPFNPASWIATVNAQAPNITTVLTDTLRDYSPDLSPDGTKIVFYSTRDNNNEIYVMDSDGSNETRITTTAESEAFPAWSPDGSKIVFERYSAAGPDIWVMNADGTGATNLTNTPGIAEYSPAWQPLPPPGHLRPKSAARVRVSLVPSFLPCQAPNRTHGPPLDDPSCAPPLAGHAFMTFGAAPAGTSPKAAGHALLNAIPGVPGGENDADVRISVNLTDVRRVSDLTDASGSLELRIPLRLTDRGSGAFASERATMEDHTALATVPCAETADPGVGSTCAVSTTASAIEPPRIPVQEGRRSVWELGQLEVWDGGEDNNLETRLGNTRIAVQGVFVP